MFLLFVATLLNGCDGNGGSRMSGGGEQVNDGRLQVTFAKPTVTMPRAGADGFYHFGIRDCQVYRAWQGTDAGAALSRWELLFEPAPYLLPTMCIVERLEMDGRYLTIEIGTQAIGAGGCCTTYAAYRTLDGESWETRPATSVRTWKPLGVKP